MVLNKNVSPLLRIQECVKFGLICKKKSINLISKNQGLNNNNIQRLFYRFGRLLILVGWAQKTW